jgi:hypothetical protein
VQANLVKKSPVYVFFNFPPALEYRKCIENKARLPSAPSTSPSNAPQPKRFESAVQNCELRSLSARNVYVHLLLSQSCLYRVSEKELRSFAYIYLFAA